MKNLLICFLTIIACLVLTAYEGEDLDDVERVEYLQKRFRRTSSGSIPLKVKLNLNKEPVKISQSFANSYFEQAATNEVRQWYKDWQESAVIPKSDAAAKAAWEKVLTEKLGDREARIAFQKWRKTHKGTRKEFMAQYTNSVKKVEAAADNATTKKTKTTSRKVK